MDDCIFCKIAAGKIPATKVYEDDHVVAFKDLRPVAPVHVLIVPRHHAGDILELAADPRGPEVCAAILRAVPEIARVTGVAADGFRLVNNCGINGGQSVRHVHFHLIGGRLLGEKIV
jgi:histidine triad (HIT) family protein